MKKNKILLTVFLAFFTFSVSSANFLDGPAVGIYDEQSGSPSYKTFDGSFSQEQSAADIGSYSSVWLEAAGKNRGDEAVLVSLTNSNDVVGQIWDGSSWGNSLTLSGGDNNIEKMDVAYESQTGEAIVVYGTYDEQPHFKTWDGSIWTGEEDTLPISNGYQQLQQMELSSNPTEDELMLLTTGDNPEIDAQIWNGDSWIERRNIADSVPGSEPIATTFTHNGTGIAVWDDGSGSTPEYKTWDGSWSDAGSVKSISGDMEWAELDAHNNENEAVLATIDSNGDMRAQVWNGSQWGNKTNLVDSASSGSEAIDVEYTYSGDVMVMYSDSSQTPQYKIWNGSSWNTGEPAVTLDGAPNWIELSSHPNTDEVLANVKDTNNRAYLQAWDGNNWEIDSETGSDASGSNGRIASFYSVADNELPKLGNLTGPSEVKTNGEITIQAENVSDGENDSLNMYCSFNQNPTPSNSILDNSPQDDSPYNLSYNYNVQENEAEKTVFCRVKDDFGYSTNQNFSYTVDGTPPQTSIVSVAGDESATFTDTKDDEETEIVVEGESGMKCRYSQTDEAYSAMPSENNFNVVDGTATTKPNLAQGTPDIYVSCEGEKGNEQKASNNLDITSLVVDYTAPTTDLSNLFSSSIQTPPYTVTIVEQDNTDGDPETEYCIGKDCIPDKSIDDGGQITFNSSDRGENILRFNSTDFVGETQDTRERIININQLPTLSSVSDNATTIQGGTTVKVDSNSSDPENPPMTMYVCSSVGASASGCSGENLCTATGTADLSCSFESETDSQEHDYYTYLYDANDEPASENPISGSYTTDSTPPEIIITEPENQSYSQTEISFSIEADEPLNNAKYEIDGTNYSMEEITSDSYTSTQNLDDGSYTVQFYANDTVNNSNTAEESFTVDTTADDTTPPSLTVRSPTNNTYYNSSILLNLTSNEDLSSASYKLDNKSFQNLGNISTTSWNASIDPDDGEHTLIFNGTDTAGNTGQTELHEFDYDTKPPSLESSGVEDADNTGETKCYSKWSDRNLDTGKVYENATETTQTVSFQNGYLNYSFSPEPGKVRCEFYATDRAGNTNSTQIIKNIQDVKKPVIESFSVPTEEEADPDKQLNFTAEVSDYAVDTVKLQYNKTGGRQNITMTDNLGTFQGSFTGEKGNYTVRVFAKDASGNIRYSEERNLSVEFEEELSVTDTIGSPRTTRLEEENPSMSLGNITLENEGDLALNLSASSNRDWIKLNNSESRDVDLSSAEEVELNVTANTSGFPTGEFDFNISIAGNKSRMITDSVLIQKERGPSLQTGFTKFSSQLTEGNTYEYIVETENAGTTNAESTNIELDVPDSFTVVSGTKNRSVGEMLVGGTSTSTVELRPTESDAEYNLTATSASTTDSSTVTRTVAVGTPPEPEVVEETNVVSDSSGGASGTAVSGGSAQLTQEQSDRLFETEEDFEVVRGTDETFSINFTNPIDYKLNNVSVELDGFLSQYLQLENSDLGTMQVNKTRQIELNVTAPDYYTSERKELVFTITGVGDTGRQEFNLTERKTVNLLIQEISREAAEKLVNQSRTELNRLSADGYQTGEVESLVSEMETALNENRYSRVKEINQEVEETASEARSTRETIQELEKSIQESEQKGIEPERSRRTLRLAEEALERGDFETASSRLSEAEDLYALETKGEFDLVNFVIRNKFKAAGGSAATLFFALFGFYRLKLNRMDNRLENLKSERTSINDEIKELQKKAFRKDEISLKEYDQKLASHKDRLMDISEKQVALVSKKSAWENFRNKKSRLKQEEEKIRDLIQDTQRNYIDREHISSESFEKRERKYRERLTEIKEELAEIEAHEKIGGGSYLP